MSLRSLFRPHMLVRQLSDISLGDLRRDAIYNIIIDLDDTVLGYRHSTLLASNERWLDEARALDMRLVIVSNGPTARVRKAAEALELPYIGRAGKPFPSAFRKALGLLGATPEQTVVVGDQLFTDVLAARLCGLRVILTRPIVTRTELWHRAMRSCERLVLAELRSP